MSRAVAPRTCRRCLSYEGMQHYLNRRAVPERHLWAFAIGEDGVCNLCHAYDDALDAELIARELLHVVTTARAGGGAVLAFSGGKDSISTLYVAKERLGLTVTAFLFDNGFIPNNVVTQAKRVCATLDVPLLIGRPRKLEQARLARIVDRSTVSDPPPCDTCSDWIARELGRVVDDVGADVVLIGTNYWIAWTERVHAAATRTTPSGRQVLFANLPFAARLTHADVVKNVKAAGAQVLPMPGMSSNCTVPALVQLRLGRAIGHVPEMEDLSLEVMVGHRTRKSALAELKKKAPALLTASASAAPASRSAAARARPSKASPKVRRSARLPR